MASRVSGMKSEHSRLALPPLIMGGAGFSFQLTPDPKSLPVLDIIKKAFASGIRAIDTSPYYEPSEQLLGNALSHPDIRTQYRRSDFILMTKCGRISEKQFDYSPAWIRKSVARSLARFQTTYLDVVFCHDVEFVSLEQAVTAVGVLFELAKTGPIRHVGISGYDIGVLIRVASQVRSTYGRSIDVVQNWAQLTLQNTRLEQDGLAAFSKLGITAVCNSSPLASGLLRAGGVPVGSLGDWHPAPEALRVAAQDAATWVHEQGDSLASVALRFSIAKAVQNCHSGLTVTTIVGISSITELHENVRTARRILKPLPKRGIPITIPSEESPAHPYLLDQESFTSDIPLHQGVTKLLGPWVDYDFSGQGSKTNKAMSVPEGGEHISNGEVRLVSRL